MNSDPIVFLREMVKRHPPRLATPESGTQEEFSAWCEEVRQKARELLGLDRMLPAPAEVAGVEETMEEGITRERFCLQTEPGYWAPVIVNRPAGTGPFPLVLCLHGHCSNGKEGVSGLLADVPGVKPEDLRKQLEHYRDTYAADLARRGYLTISLDNRDFNQAMHPEPYTYNSYGWHITHIIWQNAFGRSYIGAAVWDALKVFDYAISRKDVDQSRVGCIGFSLGGLLTMYVALMEPRIRAAVISGYFDSYLQRIVDGSGADCLCNYIPGIYAWFDIPDLTAALAPRPVLCNNEAFTSKFGAQSHAERVEQLRTRFAKVQRVYDALAVGERCELFTWEAPFHVFSGERAYPWLDQWLREKDY